MKPITSTSVRAVMNSSAQAQKINNMEVSSEKTVCC